MSQSDYIKRKKIVFELQRQKELKPILDSSFYTSSKAYSIERDISNTIITYSQLIPLKVENKCEKFITCSNTNLRPNRMTFERRMINDYRPFVKHQKLGIYKFCYDSSYNLINTNNTNRLFSAYSNKRLKDICNCVLRKSNTVVRFVSGAVSMAIKDTVFKFRDSSGALISIENAKIGDTYSLYSETDHAAFVIWNNSPGDTVMIFGVFEPLTNNKYTLVPHTNFINGADGLSRVDIPVPIEYPVKFVLNYGITSIYLYSSSDNALISPSTFFVHFTITTN